MGRLIVEQMVSVDGFAADSEGGIKFFLGDEADRDPALELAQVSMLHRVDAIVLGANTYRIFADFWPTPAADGEAVAEPINRLPKHVISNSLDRAPWGDAEVEIERGDGAESVRKLKERYEGNLIVWGSLTLADSLFEAGLVDLLRLRVIPRLIGTGRGFSPDSLSMTELELLECAASPGGHLTLEYLVKPAI
jgi:dihydrofolate reductase